MNLCAMDVAYDLEEKVCQAIEVISMSDVELKENICPSCKNELETIKHPFVCDICGWEEFLA